MEDIHQRISEIRSDFPFFSQEGKFKDWVYLDTAATSQKPNRVINAELEFYQQFNANIHRGLYEISEAATAAYEKAREQISEFLGSQDSDEIIFTRGATESINLIAQSWGGLNLQEGDEILVTNLEHHANIVPWQMVSAKTDAQLNVIPIDDQGNLDMQYAMDAIRGGKVKCMALVHVSNALGVTVEVAPLIQAAKEQGIFVLIDGSQAVTHFPVNVTKLGCDAYVFSGHKIFGPTGIGILWAKRKVLEEIPPYQGGGDMIRSVDFEGTTYAEIPAKFEAGTPHIAGAVALGEAIEYVNEVGFDAIATIDQWLFGRAAEIVESIDGLKRIGNTLDQVGVVSFYSDQIHPSDLATFLSTDKIAVRTGHHCAEPLMKRLGIPGTVRVSLGIYNNAEDLDRLEKSLRSAVTFLS